MAEKFIAGVAPETPLADAARHVLELRLGAVAEWLPKALAGAHSETENVHQLRVSTRRADAALRIFRMCLPGRAFRTARGRLRSIRRAAGGARDWDVFIQAMRERAGRKLAPVEKAGIDFLLAYALGQRHAAQGALDALAEERPTPFAGLMAATVDEVRPSHAEGEESLGDIAGPALARLSSELAEAASRDLADYELLHRVRIAGKRLRYAMEVFGHCRDAAFREKLYPRVEEMQEILGRANDSHVALGRLAAIRSGGAMLGGAWARAEAGVEALARMHARRLPQERRRFLKWWASWKEDGL
ncbi:MAG: CHAD domain-containing protein [Gemmataceae bacterium]|nr:CHAD domain-containing protein [Gemmataceae bacterium]